MLIIRVTLLMHLTHTEILTFTGGTKVLCKQNYPQCNEFEILLKLLNWKRATDLYQSMFKGFEFHNDFREME